MDSAGELLARVAALLGPDDRFTLACVRTPSDWEARTMAGARGYGDTPEEALRALIEELTDG